MESVYLMLGGNVGDRMDYLSRSVVLLSRNFGTITGMSAVYESEPWGFDDPGWFLNQAVALETDYQAVELLHGFQQIERDMGRIRTNSGYQARTIDIDILFYGNQIVETPGLVIPHPRITERMFVLKPMAELAPGLVHPVLHQTMEYLRDCCTDTLSVRKYGN